MPKPRHTLLAALILSGCAAAPEHPHDCFHRNEAAETVIGYCQAVRSDHTLYISGTAASGDMPAAIHSAYDRLQATLQAHGLGFANVVKENVYTTSLDAFIENKDLRKSYYGATLPAATWVQVQRLYTPALVLEVELVAEYPE